MREKNPHQMCVFLSTQLHYPSFDLNEAFLPGVGSKKINERLASFTGYVISPPHPKIPGEIILNNKKNTLEKPSFFKREKTVSS
jgi:hypothetical protein